jgi:hypothetical protein
MGARLRVHSGGNAHLVSIVIFFKAAGRPSFLLSFETGCTSPTKMVICIIFTFLFQSKLFRFHALSSITIKYSQGSCYGGSTKYDEVSHGGKAEIPAVGGSSEARAHQGF